MAAQHLEVHYAAPCCLLRLRDEAEGELRLAGVGAWLEFELEADRWGEWCSVRELTDARLGGRRSAWVGVCRFCP